MIIYCRGISTVAKRIELHKSRKLFSLLRPELLTDLKNFLRLRI